MIGQTDGFRVRLEEENGSSLTEQRDDRSDDEERDEDGGQRIPPMPSGQINADGGNDDPHGTQSVSEDVEENTFHVSIVLMRMMMMMMAMTMVMVMLLMAMRLTMMKDKDTDEVHGKTKAGDNEKLKGFNLWGIDQPFHRLD